MTNTLKKDYLLRDEQFTGRIQQLEHYLGPKSRAITIGGLTGKVMGSCWNWQERVMKRGPPRVEL